MLILLINHYEVASTNTVCQGFFFAADVTVLFYLVHHLQGYTAQTLMELLWGVDLLVFPSGAAALRPNILWSTPHPKITQRDNINGVPINARNCLSDRSAMVQVECVHTVLPMKTVYRQVMI